MLFLFSIYIIYKRKEGFLSMITKTVNLDSSYESLFAEIKAKSNGSIDIENLEGFFGNIQSIAALDEKFLRLPLDEPMFEIDANSRKIEIPNDFRTNGISVQGDHLAETIFFSIDRYFDYTDLSTTDININWKMGNESGKTKNFILSKDIIPGRLVFGWPINNVVTAKSGALQFAVEFFKTDNSGVIYRLNTLAATANIKDGLIVDENAEAVDLDTDIKRALTNSAFGEGEAAVGDIAWKTGDGHGPVTGVVLSSEDQSIISFNPDEWKETLNLNTIINATGEPASVSTNLIAQAFVDGQTRIRYTDNDGNNIFPAMIQVNEVHVPVADRSNLSDNKKYYLSDSVGAAEASAEDIADPEVALFEVAPLNDDLIYYVKLEGDAHREATAEELAAWGTKDAVTLYSEIAVINVNGAGSYIIKAQGEKWISQPKVDAETGEPILDENDEPEMMEVKIGAGDMKRSDIVTVPAAKGPDAIEIVAADELPDFNPAGENYHIDDSYENVIFMPEDGRNVKAVAEFENLGAAQFVWEKKDFNENDSAFAPLSEEAVPFELTNENAIENAQEGVYRVKVKNFINNTMSEEVASANYTLSKLASPIESANVIWMKPSANAPQGAPYVVGDSVTFSPNGSSASRRTARVTVGNIVPNLVEKLDTTRSTEVRYQWERSSDIDNAVENPEAVSWEFVSDSAEILISVEAVYRVKVQNVYNGSVYTKILPPFVANAL